MRVATLIAAWVLVIGVAGVLPWWKLTLATVVAWFVSIAVAAAVSLGYVRIAKWHSG